LDEIIIPNIKRDKYGNIPIIPVINYAKAEKSVYELSNIKSALISEDFSFLIDEGGNEELKTNEEMNFVLTNQNDLFFWSYEKDSTISRPIKIFLDKKITVSSISCGKNFCILLTKQGTLYSLGKKNKFGELGSGDFNPRESPELIYSLVEAGEKIVQVECGYKHVIARNGIGKVFAWGNVF